MVYGKAPHTDPPGYGISFPSRTTRKNIRGLRDISGGMSLRAMRILKIDLFKLIVPLWQSHPFARGIVSILDNLWPCPVVTLAFGPGLS